MSPTSCQLLHPAAEVLNTKCPVLFPQDDYEKLSLVSETLDIDPSNWLILDHMKFVVHRQDLEEALLRIQGIVPLKPPIPILSNILIQTESGGIVITATDLLQSVRTFVRAHVERHGSVTIPAKTLTQLIREMRASQIIIEETQHKVEIRHDGHCFALHAMPVSDFPAFPSIHATFVLKLKSEQLQDLLQRVSFSAAKDDSRAVLNGVLLEVIDGMLNGVATDGKRLAKNSLTIGNQASAVPEGRLAAAFPIKSIEEIIRLLPTDKEAELSIMNDKAALVVGQTTLVTKLIQGNYPDYEPIVTQHGDVKRIVLHKEELGSMLRQVSLFTSENASSVRFEFENNELRLRASNQQIGEGAVSMPVDYRSEKLEIAFNPQYALQILRHSKGETIEFYLVDSYHQGLIRDGSGALFVLMPMRLTEREPAKALARA